MIPPVAASEAGLAQTGAVATPRRGCRARDGALSGCERNRLESRAAAGESPLREASLQCGASLSSAGHVQSRVNPPGPSGKAEHSLETDSEQVP